MYVCVCVFLHACCCCAHMYARMSMTTRAFRSSADAVNSDGGAGSIDFEPLQPTQTGHSRKHHRKHHRIIKNVLPRDTEDSQPPTFCIRNLLTEPSLKIRLA